MRKSLLSVPLAASVLVLCTSCGPRPVVAASPSSQAASAQAPALPTSIQWMQSSAEYMGIAVQTYRLATTAVETAARGRAPGTWAAVLDADDTVINNLSYQAGLVLEGARHTPERFTAFVRTRASTPVPGAAKFLARVRELGGRIGIVTNRLSIECDDTAAMLRQLSLAFDAVICRAEGGPANADKTPRYEAIAAGQTAVSRTPVEILVFVGDNIMDFPGATQVRRAQGESGFPEFGVRWFLLPNPMYGSWQ
jgi:5'-nucleotidase (lipoprotein e(P4) family)